MGEVVQFVKKTEYQLDDSELVNTNTYSIVNICGKTMVKPTTKYEYLMVCKSVMPLELYTQLCLGIMDHDVYNNELPKYLKEVVNMYYTFPS